MKTPEACIERERLFAYSHHMLQRAEEEQVKGHLESCAECREIVAGFQSLDCVLEEWKPVEPSPWFDARARARIASGAEARSWRFVPHFTWRAWASVAAVAALVVMASVVMLRPSRSTHGVQMAQTPVVKAANSPGLRGPVNPSGPSGAAAAGEAGETSTVAQSQPANQEIDLYKNLNVLENYDMLANFDVLSEIPEAGGKASD